MSKHTIYDYAIGRENNFDLIRFIAAVMVVFSHSYSLSLGADLLDPLKVISHGQMSSGKMGVAVFFIISGYLVSQSYFTSKSILAFIKARVLRIFPALIAVIVLSTFVLGPLITTFSIQEYFNDSKLYSYLKNIFLFPTMYWHLPGVFESNIFKGAVNGSIYTLPHEVSCYVALVFLGLLGVLGARRFILFIFLISLYLVITKAPQLDAGFMGMRLQDLLRFSVYFLSGMIFYTFRKHIPFNSFLFVVSVVVLVTSLFWGNLKELFAIFGGYIIFYVAYNSHLKAYHFSKYGDFSYGIYLYSFPIQQTITSYNGGQMSPTINFAITLPLSLLCAIFSWHLVEKHCLKLKKYDLTFSMRTYFKEIVLARVQSIMGKQKA